MAKRWRVHPHDPDRIASLQRATDVPAVVAQLLICRNMVDPEAIRAFLDPKLSSLRDPQLLPGCADAADIVITSLPSADAFRKVVADANSLHSANKDGLIGFMLSVFAGLYQIVTYAKYRESLGEKCGDAIKR